MFIREKYYSKYINLANVQKIEIEVYMVDNNVPQLI